jgi:ribosomal protein S18 acetylase RimI-like enzyme
MIEHGEVPKFEPRAERLTEPIEEDLASLAEILPAAFNSISVKDLEEFIPMVIGADTADVLVSRNEEGKIVSVMIVNIDYGAAKLRGHIDEVATHKDHRRQGHATTILDAAILWFEAKGVNYICLTSNDDRTASHALYESRGFKVRDTNNFELYI